MKNTNFTNIKALFLIDNMDVNKILVPNKISFCKKDFGYFIGYKVAKKK